MVIPPPVLDPPLPTERVPTQQTTDLRHIAALAARHGYVAYVVPGPVPGTSTFYWGPPVRVGPAAAGAVGRPRRADQRHVSAPTFRTDALAPMHGRRVRCRTRARADAMPVHGTGEPATAARRRAAVGDAPPTCAPGGCGRAGPATATAFARAQAAMVDRARRRGRRRGRARRRRGTAPCCARAAWSGCAGPAGPTTGSGTCARSCTTLAPGGVHADVHARARGLRRRPVPVGGLRDESRAP